MLMKLSELEKRRLIKKHPIDKKKTEDALALANRDISTAIDLLQTKDFEKDNIMFDRMRRKRHALVYDVAGSMSQTEAHNAVMRAKEFVQKIQKLI